MNFKVIVKNQSGSEKWILNYAKGKINEELNKDRGGSLSFVWEDVEAVANGAEVTPYYILANGLREIELYDSSNNLVFSGFIGDLQDTKNKNGNSILSVPIFGYFTLLSKRITEKEKIYSSQDSADIAWDLIDTTQNLTYGDLGITRGTHPTTKTRQRTFYYEEIKKAIEGMGSEEVKEGFDFEIDVSKIFNIFYPSKGSQRDEIILKDGKNINDFQINKSGLLGMSNQVTVIGEGQGADVKSEVRNAENVYKENFGLLQDVLAEKDVSLSQTLQDKGDRYIEEYKNQRLSLMLNVFYDDPSWQDYQVGDWLKVIIPSRDIDGFYRLIKRQLDINNETVDLFLRQF